MLYAVNGTSAADISVRPLSWRNADRLSCILTWLCPDYAGFGAFGAVGFSYGGEAAAAAAVSESESDSDDSEATEEGSDGEAGGGGGDVDVEVAAAAFGVDNFAVMLRRAEREEEAIANGKVPRPK